MLLVLEIIGFSISIAFVLLLFLACFFVGTGLMKVVGAIIKFLSYPLRKLWNVVSNLLDKCEESLVDGRKGLSFGVFGGFRGFLIILCKSI